MLYKKVFIIEFYHNSDNAAEKIRVTHQKMDICVQYICIWKFGFQSEICNILVQGTGLYWICARGCNIFIPEKEIEF